jgi:site-specific recombinase XerD
MIGGLSYWPSVQLKHTSAPLLKEREQYLNHLVALGRSRRLLRMTASFMIHLVEIMKLTELRQVSVEEIRAAADLWVIRQGTDRESPRKASPEKFIRAAKNWLTFHAVLVLPAPPIFSKELREYEGCMLKVNGLAGATVRGYSEKIAKFLRWLEKSHSTLHTVNLVDIDEFFEIGLSSGHDPGSVASQCQALRSFFSYAEIRGWCRTGIPSAIRSPRRSRYLGPPRGPAWAEVRRLINSIGNFGPKELRARAVLLLLAIYGLRRSEIAQLRLDDFDWGSETFVVRRAKRGGLQYYPMKFEVGEAIIRYLKFGRPNCTSRQLFVSLYAPHAPLSRDGFWQLVNARMKAAGIQPVHRGPHALRHACATHLLRQGSSLQEIADFLGHRNIDTVGIYARYDTRLLKKVAAFSLAEVR